MTDIEKVIKGLQAHESGCGYRSHNCDDMDCPYRYGDESCDIEEMCHDALELLKEQHPKTGHWDVLTMCANEGTYCSVCHTKIFDFVHPPKKKLSQYCPHCGAKMEDENNFA